MSKNIDRFLECVNQGMADCNLDPESPTAHEVEDEVLHELEEDELALGRPHDETLAIYEGWIQKHRKPVTDSDTLASPIGYYEESKNIWE